MSTNTDTQTRRLEACRRYGVPAHRAGCLEGTMAVVRLEAEEANTRRLAKARRNLTELLHEIAYYGADYDSNHVRDCLRKLPGARAEVLYLEGLLER